MAGEINPDITYHMMNPSETNNKSTWETEETEEGTVFHQYDENGKEINQYVQRDGAMEEMMSINDAGQVDTHMIDTDGDEQGDIYVTYDYDDSYQSDHESVRYIDYDLDGTVDVTSGIDDNGNITYDEIDLDGDGKADLHVDYVYDNSGNISQRIIDENGDGQPDVVSTVDVNNRILADEVDTDGDGVLDTHVEYTYNEEGEITGSTERPLIKAPAAATIPSSCTVDGAKILNDKGEQIGIVITTEQNGEKVQTIYSFGKEAPKEDTVTFEDGKYTDTDPEGRVVAEDFDSDGDGVLDTHVEYTYEDGKQSVSKKNKLKPAPENVEIPPQCTVKGSRIIGPQGNQIGVVITTTEDGQEVQKIYLLGEELKEDTVTFEDGTYTIKGADGRTQFEDSDTSGDGKLNKRTEYVYDENGDVKETKTHVLQQLHHSSVLLNNCKFENNSIIAPDGRVVGAYTTETIDGKEVKTYYIYSEYGSGY